MSHTDKTDPYWVKTRRPGCFKENHDHRDGICNISWDINTPGYWRGCHYEGIWYRLDFCGCRLCTGYWERKWERRRERYEGKRQAREWDREW